MLTSTRRINIRRIILIVSFITLAATIASLTIGRDIYENKGSSIVSFAIVNFSGYLFFLFIPVELAFVYYLNTVDNLLLLNFVALATAIVSQSIDYLIGYFFSSEIIDRLIGRRRFEKAEHEVKKYGKLALVFFNLFPLSSPIIVLAAGMLKYRFKEVLIYSCTGLVIKYLLITLIFLIF